MATAYCPVCNHETRFDLGSIDALDREFVTDPDGKRYMIFVVRCERCNGPIKIDSRYGQINP